MKKMTDLVTVYKFIPLLTFELSSFRENGFLFYYISHAVAADTSCWMPKSMRKQNRENGHTGQLL